MSVVRHASKKIIKLSLCGLAILFLLGPVGAMAQDANEIKKYATSVSAVQTALNEGRIADAKKGFGELDSALGNFETNWLRRRMENAPESGPAPDLIQFVPNPKVTQVRYGVLNEHNLDLVFICRDGGLRRFNLNDLKEEPAVVAHPDGSAVWRGMFSADGKSFFSGHENGEVLVWDSESWEILQSISVSDKPIRELAVAPDGKAFLAEGADEIELWSLDGEPKKVAGVGQRLNFGEGVAFSPKGDLIATGGMFDINLMDAKTGKVEKSMTHASYTMGLLFSPDGKFIASAPRGNVNKFIGVFSIEDGESLFNAGPFGNYIAGMAFTPDGKRIAATGCEKLLRVFDSKTGTIVLTLDRKECGAQPAFSSDGKLLGWSEPDGFYFIDLRKPD